MAKKKNKNSNFMWVMQITILAFFISFGFSFASEIILSNVGTILSVVILIIFILIGVLFDMIGTAVAVADISQLNSMSARKVKAADVAVNFKRNAEKVSSFCNDVIGDICGIISGSAGAMVAVAVSQMLKADVLLVTLTVTGFVAAMTIGGKALGKGVALKNSTNILHGFAIIVSIFYKPKK